MDFPSQIQAKLDALGIMAGDIDEKFIRGAGPGGQKINKTSSTVWLRHRPTGIEVRCQRERSQAANRELAWTELCEKLAAAVLEAARARRHEIEKDRRRSRPKSRRQKAIQVAGKRHRAGIKSQRGRPAAE